MMIWTSEDASAATDGKTAGSWQAGALSIDSRSIRPGELFVALKGEHADGHAYVADALSRGAAAAMVSHAPANVAAGKLLIVPDTQQALEDLAGFSRARSEAHIVGLTGSVGKTSTKEMLRQALIPHGETFASHGNFNNHIGTPLNLASLPPSAAFAVFEMGMNHAGEIAALTQQVRPHVALITNVEPVHLEFFKNVEAIADAKCEIFGGLEPGGAAVLNHDSPYFTYCLAQAKQRGVKRIVSFGTHAQADCRIASYKATLEGSQLTVSMAGKEISFTTGTIGAHWALTAASVLAVAHALQLDAVKTARALSVFRELPGRGSLHSIPVQGGTATLVDDSYNASPAAMHAAFAKLRELRNAGASKGRIIAALGDMRELGPTAPELHAGLAKDLKASHVDMVFTAGTLMKHLHEALPPALRAGHAIDAAALLPVLLAALKPDDLLLVKGSHGSHMYTIAEALLAPASANGGKRHAV